MIPSHYRIIKCLGFKSIYYAINLYIVSYFMMFSEVDYVFVSMYY